MQWVLVPVKDLGRANSRLGLEPASRIELGIAMLRDVLAAATDRHVALVTTDRRAIQVGAELGALVIEDPGDGLNPALDHASSVLSAKGASVLAVIPADVPWITHEDLDTLFSTSAEVVVVPSPDGGTNALVTRPPGVIPARFGPGSAEAHRLAAEGRTFETLSILRLARDIDGPDDLRTLAASGGPSSATVARELLASVE